jgi:hypothetical protein
MHLRNICMRREMRYCKSDPSQVGHARRVKHYELGQCIIKFFSHQTEECRATCITDYQTSSVKNMEIPKVNICYSTSDIRVSNLKQKFLTRHEIYHKYVLRLPWHWILFIPPPPPLSFLFPPMAHQSLVGQSLLMNEASQSLSVRHTTLSMTPLDEWSAQCRDLCLTTRNNRKRQTSMSPAGFEPIIPAS